MINRRSLLSLFAASPAMAMSGGMAPHPPVSGLAISDCGPSEAWRGASDILRPLRDSLYREGEVRVSPIDPSVAGMKSWSDAYKRHVSAQLYHDRMNKIEKIERILRGDDLSDIERLNEARKLAASLVR